MRQVRDLLVVKTCGPEVALLDVFGPSRKDMEAVAARLSTPALVAAMGYLGEARTRASYVVDARPIGELALVRAVVADRDGTAAGGPGAPRCDGTGDGTGHEADGHAVADTSGADAAGRAVSFALGAGGGRKKKDDSAGRRGAR